jgi:ribosomal protein S27AE
MRTAEPGTPNRNGKPGTLNPERQNSQDESTTCPRCGESHDLAKVKGCIKCLKCGFKFDCNGW